MEAKKKTQQVQQHAQQPHEEEETLVRIFGYDIPGNRNLYTGLTKIKGISWSVANAVCVQLGLNKGDKISSLNKSSIAAIERALSGSGKSLPEFLKNRQKDLDSGEGRHLLASDLDMQHEFDIKRLKKMKSYKGIRHSLGQPVRGQRTRSHFRRRGASVGVKKREDAKKK